MDKTTMFDKIFKPSQGIVAREIEGEIIIVPIEAGVGDSDDELYSFNETGRAVWNKIDGTRTVRDIIEALISEYESRIEEIEEDVIGLLKELHKRKIIAESPR